MSIAQNIQISSQLAGAVMNRRLSYLIIFITAKCNLLCSHCFYTEEILKAKSKKELTLDEYEKIARQAGTLTNVNFTGGEPFIRPDLADVVHLFRRYAKVPFVGITTNGLLRRQILEGVEKIVSQKGPAYLKLGVSLDGFREVHDRVRNRVGSFEEAVKTIHALEPLRKRFPHLMVYVSTTLTKYNKADILPFIDFVRNEVPVDAHYLGYIRGIPMEQEAKEVTLDEYRQATRHLQNSWNMKNPFFNILNLTNNLMLSVNQRIIEKNEYVMPCVAGEKMLTITEEGFVKPCEVLEQIGISPYIMGNLRDHDYDLYQVLGTPAAREIRRKILDDRCFCTFECANQASIAFKLPNLVKAASVHFLNRS